MDGYRGIGAEGTASEQADCFYKATQMTRRFTRHEQAAGRCRETVP